MIPIPTLAWPALSPILIVTATSFACLALDIVPGVRRIHLAAVGILGLAGAALASALMWGGPAVSFQQMVVADDFALFFNGIFVVTTALVLLLSVGYVRRQAIEAGEYYILLLFAALGMMLMAAAQDLLIIFLGLELMSLSLYVLAGFFRARPTGNESSMKYFLLGAFSSGFFLYGIALLYGATGTTNLARLGAALETSGPERHLVLAGLALLLVGFGFKTSAVPFHQWAPDVYEGAPTAVTALIATGSKAAAFAALLRVIFETRVLQPDWTTLLWIMAALTMTVGNVIALAQRNLKRMLAYSSVAHVGYMLVGLTAGTGLGGAAVLFYLLVYSFATVGAFGVILLLERGEGAEAVEIDAYGGLAARHPLLAVVLTVCLMSLIGLPPTAGFIGKFYLFSAAIQEKFIWLAVIAVLNSVIAAYYYLRLIVYMYMREPEPGGAHGVLTPAAGLALALAVWATLHFGLLPGAAFAFARRAIAPLLS
jgi:NADH-quinone oxidoreductase subunit N